MSNNNKNITYKDAGVDTIEGARAVDLMKPFVKSTSRPEVLTGLGGFAGLFKPDLSNIASPVLVSGTDGVGTKLKLAFLMDKHNTIGIDCVAMCVNDILCQGAEPLFFLDYIATGKVEAEKIAEIVKGVATGCKESGCALIGGETAEMPDFYQANEYDLAGFAVGIVDEKEIITGNSIEAGDVLVGISSSGIHSNGFSLIRKVLLEQEGLQLDAYIPQLKETLGEALLRPTKLYSRACSKLKGTLKPKGIVHITGGGFFENIPRIIPKNLGVQINTNAWETPMLFNYIQEKAGISTTSMFETFNMGIGMIFVFNKSQITDAMDLLQAEDFQPAIIGSVVDGEGVILAKH